MSQSPKGKKVKFAARTSEAGGKSQIISGISHLGEAPARRDPKRWRENVRDKLLKSFNNTPIFIIQCHGEFRDSLSVTGKENNITWKSRGTSAVSTTGENQWIIQNSPLGYLGAPTTHEDRFAANVGNNFNKTKTRIFSSNAQGLFTNYETKGRAIRGVPMFVPPHTHYANKTHAPWDTDPEWTFSMVVLPIFQPLDVKKLQAELPKYPWKFFYPSEGVGGKFPATATDFEDKKWIYDCRRGCPGPPATRGSGKREFIREEEHPYELEDIKDATKKGKRKPRAEFDLFEDGTRIFGPPDGFENRTPASKYGRLVNRQILEDNDFWVVGPNNKYWPTMPDGSKQPLRGATLPSQPFVKELRVKYRKFVKSWEALIPNEGVFPSAAATAAGGGAVAQGMSGGHQLFSTMLSILGQGVFISLSCSPAHADAIGAQASVKGALANVAWNGYINKLCEASLSEWKALFGEGRPTRASKPGPLKLEITLDDLPRFLEGRGLQAATRLATRSVRSLGGCPYVSYAAEIHDYGQGGGRRRRKKTKRRRRKTRKRRSQHKRRKTRRRRHGRKTRRRRHRRKTRRRRR